MSALKIKTKCQNVEVETKEKSWFQETEVFCRKIYKVVIWFQEQDVAEYADYEQDGDFSLEITNHLNYPDSMHQSETGHSVI